MNGESVRSSRWQPVLRQMFEELLALLRTLVPQALALLGALPDGSAGDPTSLMLLARRQAQALAWGRRQHLARLATRLGLEMSSLPYGPVPRRLQRPYELIGWCPPQANAKSAGDRSSSMA